MNRMTFQLAGATILGAALLVSPAMAADTLTVEVGYADNLRASGFFPSPWIGSTFNGQTVISQTNLATAGTFDSGAVRIDNTNTTGSEVISNFQVSFNNGAVVYNIWGAGTDLTLAAGQSGIFTQTSASENFDSSDQGLFGGTPPAELEPNNADHNGNTNLIGGCSSPSSFYTSSDATTCAAKNAPVITFSVNGSPVSFTDTGFILNTGEWDFVNNNLYGEDGNESIQWNSLGGTSRGGTGTPEPSSLFVPIGALIAGIVYGRKRRIA